MEDAEVVRRYREALGNGDLSTALDFLDPDLVFYPPEAALGLSRDNLRELWSAGGEEYEHLTSSPELGDVELLPDGRCFSVSREIMRWRENGEVAAVVERGSVRTLRDSKIVEIHAYPSVEAARTAVETTA